MTPRTPNTKTDTETAEKILPVAVNVQGPNCMLLVVWMACCASSGAVKFTKPYLDGRSTEEVGGKAKEGGEGS